MKKYFLLFLVAALFAACTTPKEPHARYDILPLPTHLVEKEGEFRLNNSTEIVVPSGDEAVMQIASLFAEQVKITSGIKLKIRTATNNTTNVIIFEPIQNDELGTEGYRLLVNNDKIVLQANAANGFFYAVQTMFQMLPPEIYGSQKVKNVNWTIACVEIYDSPRFGYRGMHLDVCRHFFSIEFVKKYIDILAMQKMNRFHWHLTDDQGWRIEIKKYPKLNEIGSWRSGSMVGRYSDHKYDTVRHGGFYTQEQIKEVVAYAATKYIEVIPEVEMPGHALAAVASYPWLCCRKDTVFDVCQKWGVFDQVFCTTDSVFMFLEDVLAEVMPLFPSEYIHIGGDECPKTYWKQCPHCQAMIKKLKLKDEHSLQSYFIQRIEKFVNANGKKIIGWDEILEGGLAPNATVMSWRGEEGAIEAANQNHDAIMTPTSHCYFDYYQSRDTENEPISIGGFLPLEKVYSLNPIPEKLSADKHQYIIGVQANIWTEYILTTEHVEYMMLPRSVALAEVAWTRDEQKNFDDFLRRLQTQFQRYDFMGVNYRPYTAE